MPPGDVMAWCIRALRLDFPYPNETTFSRFLKAQLSTAFMYAWGKCVFSGDFLTHSCSWLPVPFSRLAALPCAPLIQFYLFLSPTPKTTCGGVVGTVAQERTRTLAGENPSFSLHIPECKIHIKLARTMRTSNFSSVAGNT